MSEYDLPASVANAFDLDGKILDIRLHGRGLIHDTYLVTTSSTGAPRAILQRINRRAFARPELIMENMRTLLEHVGWRQHGDSERAPPSGRGDLRFPALYRSRDGADLVVDAEGGMWRAMTYIDRTRVFHRPENTAQSMAAGRALGRFHELVSDLEPLRMHDTRPDFHHTPRHIERLDQVIAHADRRRADAPEVAQWLAFIAERRAGADAIEHAVASGRIPRQVVHGDPKLDNVLFDEDSDTAVSLIDLDTVKPGTIHHDIADCLRSCCNSVGESPDTDEAVRYDLDMCHAVLAGYFDETRGSTLGLRAEDLYEAIRLIPFELGVRFLTDYLDGSRYFRVEYPEQNRLRAATQFRLSAEVERHRQVITEMAGQLIEQVR